MKKEIVLKIVAMVILNVFVLSTGVMSFAKMIEADQINWDYLNSCGYIFEETDDYGIYDCGGSTTTGSGKMAYVLVEVLQLQNIPNQVVWDTYYSFYDEDYAIAACEEDVELEPGYTYRLRVTHQVKTMSGDLLEEYVHYSGMTAVLPID